MKKLLAMCCLAGCCMALRASSVVWGMFTVGTGSVSDPVSGNNVPGIGIRCYCAEEGFAYLMADVGLSYNMQGGRITSVSSAAFQQTLTGQALFVWAFAGDALTDAYLEQAALVVDYRQGVGVGEAYGDQSMPVNPGDSLYLAFKARGFVCEEGETFPGQEDIYGWIRFEVFEDRLELDGSAFGDKQGLIVGTGDYSSTSIPEPSSGLLLSLGMSVLALRRRRPAPGQCVSNCTSTSH